MYIKRLGSRTLKGHVIFCLDFAGYVGSLGDKPRVEIKGRFSVTSENVDLAKVRYLLSNAYTSIGSAYEQNKTSVRT